MRYAMLMTVGLLGVPLAAAWAAAPPAGGSISIEPVGGANADRATAAFVTAASDALADKGFTILEDPGHSAYVADMTLTVPSYISDKMPLTAAAELPGAFRNVCEAVKAYHQLTREGQILATQEYGANRVRALMSFPIAPSALVVSSPRKVTTLHDLEGLKLRTSGGAHDLTRPRRNDAPCHEAAARLVELLVVRSLRRRVPWAAELLLSEDLQGVWIAAGRDVSLGFVVLVRFICENRGEYRPRPISRP